MAKTNKKEAKPSDVSSPTTYSNVYVRTQPFFNTYSIAEAASSTTEASAASAERLQFLIYLYDPAHNLTHTSLTQAVPAGWIDIWDERDWVEDLVADGLRLGVEVIGQEYVVSRMGWTKKDSEPEEAEPAPGPADKEKKLEDS